VKPLRLYCSPDLPFCLGPYYNVKARAVSHYWAFGRVEQFFKRFQVALQVSVAEGRTGIEAKLCPLRLQRQGHQAKNNTSENFFMKWSWLKRALPARN
jgi:hypothetical protein